MVRWLVVVVVAMLGCGGAGAEPADGEGGGAPVAEDAGAEDAAQDAPVVTPGEPDAAPPTCVAWVDACHVRACPSGDVSARADGTPCPDALCPTGAGPCMCVAGECARP